jgi:hypothetical protein
MRRLSVSNTVLLIICLMYLILYGIRLRDCRSRNPR